MKRFSRHSTQLALALLAALLPLSTGCQAPWSSDWKFTDMFRLDKGMPWDDDGPTKGVPVRLVGTWTDTVLQQAGKKPQRGFGGRLIFYGKKNNEPILVDGQVVVYAFDESNREPTDHRPTRRYVFPQDQVALHMSESELGPTYSFWLPWDEVGGPQTEISLIARFEPQGGAVVVGEQTRHLLPGTLGPRTMLAQNTPPKLPDGIPMRPAVHEMSYSNGGATGTPQQAQLAIYESPAVNTGTTPASGMPGDVATQQPAPRRMTTTSISLPENFRLRGGSAPARRASTPTNVQPIRAEVQPPMQTAPAQGFGGGDAPARWGIGGGDAPARWPYAPNPAVTPLSQSAAAPNFGTGLNVTLPSTQAMPPQAQMPAATEVATTVSYLSPTDSARWGLRPQSSTGSPPSTPPAPTTPVFQ